MNAALRVVVIEDSAPLRAYLCHLLGELEGVEVVAEASDEQGAISALAQRECDLAIVDLELASGSGLGVLEACRKRNKAQKMVVLSNYATPDVRMRCAQLGVDAVFDKSNEIEALVDYCIEHRRSHTDANRLS